MYRAAVSFHIGFLYALRRCRRCRGRHWNHASTLTVRLPPSVATAAKWQRVSKAYLRKHQLCVKCMAEGKYVTATVVDHIVPHRGDHYLMWSDTNWQALCKSCHDRKTGNEVTAYLQAVLWDSEIIGLVAQIHEYKGRHELYLKQKPAEFDRLIEIAKFRVLRLPMRLKASARPIPACCSLSVIRHAPQSWRGRNHGLPWCTEYDSWELRVYTDHITAAPTQDRRPLITL